MGFIADAVGSAVSWVGSAISDVAEFVVDDILSPVIDTVGGVIQGMADDPLGTIIMIGATLTGSPWVIAAASAANTARNGGDVGDMLIAAAASYAGSYVGGYVGDAVGGYVGEAVGETAGRIASRAASSATRAGVSAALTGGDIGAALLNGAVSGAASAGLSELGDYVKSEYSNSLDVDEISTDAEYADSIRITDSENPITAPYADPIGIPDFEGFDDTFISTKDSIFNELSDLVEGFQELPEVVQDMVTGGASAAISSLVTTGEINEDLVAGSIMSAVITTGIIKETIADSELFTADTNEARLRSAMLTNIVSDTIKAGYAGADPYQAFQASFNNQAISGLRKAIDDATEGGLDRIIDEITGAQAAVNEKYTAANQTAAEVDIARGLVQEIYDEYTAAIDKYNADINVSITDQATANARLAEINTIKARLDGFVSSYQTVEAEYTTAVAEYNTATDGLIRSEQYIDEIMQPVNEVANKYMVETLTGYSADENGQLTIPNFKAEEYRELYNLPEDVDPYKHWIATGRRNDISQEVRDTKVDETIRAKLGDVILANVDTKLNSIEDIDDLVNSVKASVGGDIAAANSDGVLLLAQEYLDGVEARTPTGNVSIARDEGVTDADIASGKALAIFNRVGKEVGITFTKTPNLGAPVFDARLNRTVQPIYDASLKYLTNQLASGKVVYIDPKTKQPIEGYISGDIQPDGTVLFGDNTTAIRNLPPPAPTLAEVAKVAPVVAIDAAGNLNINQEEYNKLDWGTRQLLNFSKNAVEFVNEREQLAKETDADYDERAREIKDLAAWGLRGGGEMLKGVNDFFEVFLNSRNNPVDLSSSNLAKLAITMSSLSNIAESDLSREEYKTFGTDVKNATGIVGTTKAVIGGVAKAPWAVLGNLVGTEILPEVLTAVAGGGVGIVVKSGAKAAQLSAQQAMKWGRASAWGTAAGIQVLETAGSAAGETYQELYDKMIQLGVDPVLADQKAQEAAVTTGLTAALIEGIAGRIFSPTDLLASNIASGVNKKALVELSEGILEKATRIGAEGLSEGIEEGAIAALKIAFHEQIDPTVTQRGGIYEDRRGDIAAASLLGALAGTGTASAITLGDVALSAVRGGTYTYNDVIPEEFWTQQAEYAANKPQPSSNPAANAVILFNPTVNEAVANANAPDVDPDVRAQAQQTIKDTLNWGSFFDDQGQVLDFSEDADGAWSYQTATDILNAANDNAYTTYGEAQEAYQAVEDQTPYELSDAEISGFVGETPDTDVSGRVIDTVNRGYATQIFEQEGYTPTEEEISTALEQAGEGGVLTETLGTELATLYDPRAVTQEEAQQAFEELGFFDALPTDVQRLVGQYAESELAGRTQDQLPVASYNAIAELIGKPAQQVTGADIDFITDLIAQREVMSEPAPFTAQQLQYDVTGDNVIDINDQIVLQNLQQSQQTGQQIGQATQINPTTQFAATGITSQIADMNARLQRQQQMQNVQQFASMLKPGGRGAIKTLDVEQDPLYFYNPITSEGIFATPQQSGVFNAEDFFGLGLAAAEGGLVEDKTDEIMSILGGKRG